MLLNPKQIDQNSKTLLDVWTRCTGDQNNSQETKGSQIKSKLVTHNVKVQSTILKHRWRWRTFWVNSHRGLGLFDRFWTHTNLLWGCWLHLFSGQRYAGLVADSLVCTLCLWFLLYTFPVGLLRAWLLHWTGVLIVLSHQTGVGEISQEWPKYGTSCFLNCNVFGLSLIFFSRRRSRMEVKFLMQGILSYLLYYLLPQNLQSTCWPPFAGFFPLGFFHSCYSTRSSSKNFAFALEISRAF